MLSFTSPGRNFTRILFSQSTQFFSAGKNVQTPPRKGRKIRILLAIQWAFRIGLVHSSGNQQGAIIVATCDEPGFVEVKFICC